MLVSFFNPVVGAKESPPLIRVKARIPELHAMLPSPENYLSAASNEQALVSMYPTFIAKSITVESPGPPGSLIWVDFGNKKN